MNRFRKITCLGLLFIPIGLFAQEAEDAGGIHWGGMHIRPEASILEAYDNRVLLDRTSGDSVSDLYTEVAAGVSVNNQQARYGLSADARYGYRFYSDNTDLNDDLYSAGVAVLTDENPFKWGLSADVVKSLDYNTYYDSSTGSGPGSILTNQPNRVSTARGNIGYELPLTEKTVITPSYNIMHYYQEFEGPGTEEWQTHTASLMVGHQLSEQTELLVGGYYILQANNDEDGSIGIVGGGASSRITDKVSWQVLGGVGYADYELSGSDMAGLLDLKAQWQATEKVSVYAFYGNNYQPGYGGGSARMVYRAGYGANWQPATRWSLGGSVLHDYQDSVGGGTVSPSVGEVRHFFSAQCGYNIARKWQLSLLGRYVNDEYETDQTVLSLKLSYTY